jgi:hypothetical protein
MEGKMSKEKKILVDESIRRRLRNIHKVSDVTIRRALSGENVTTLLHVRIRESAINLGGAYKD